MNEDRRTVRTAYLLPPDWTMEAQSSCARPDVTEYRATGPNGQATPWYTFQLDAANEADRLSREGGEG